MRSYAERTKFQPRHFTLLKRASNIVETIPTFWARDDPFWAPADTAPELRCHELARAIGRVMDLPIQDGQYGVMEHTWLWTESFGDERRPHILDVYTGGRMPQVQLVDYWSPLPEVVNYRTGPERDDIKADLVDALVEWIERMHL